MAFAAGILSFVSPCVLPLVPAYLSYITGRSVADLAEVDRVNMGSILPSAFAFVAGLSIVLSLFGLGVTVIGQALADYQGVMTRVAGAIVIVFGLHTAGLIRIPLLYRESRVDFTRFGGQGVGGALLMGGAFGIGWTPCVGAILASILALASQSETLGQGTLLLFAYSLGMGVPFIVAALGIQRATALTRWLRTRHRPVELVSGALLIGMGVLLFTDQMILITAWFTRVFGYGLAL
ncbi:MAG: cytochrome c biogenesis protein CcdA [Chloroflexota bacterium]|nr:MAG: cytochrome c biogenesis protein CcdA [Chloroflexota bacterium]